MTILIEIMVLLIFFTSCSFNTIEKELLDTRVFNIDTLVSKEINIVVTNQADNVTFETNSLILNYNDKAVCKTFDTIVNYIDSIVLHGKLYNDKYVIYNGDIHIPIMKRVPYKVNYIDLKLYNGCNWYSTKGCKVLQSIMFNNIEVNDWEEQ